LAEDIGLDYVFSMSKWWGFGGETPFWDSSLESVSLMTALAVRDQARATHRHRQSIAFHPTVMAKMAATPSATGPRLVEPRGPSSSPTPTHASQ